MIPSLDTGARHAGPEPNTVGFDESAFVRRLQEGDQAAFADLVRREGGRLLAVARRFLRCEEDAQDAVQQAFLSAFRAMPTFHAESRLSTWLHRIVVNCALMKLRRQRRRPEDLAEDIGPRFLEDGHHVVTFAPWPESAEEAMVRDEVRAQVRAAIDALPERHRSVLLVRDIEGLTTEEAASLFGVTPNAVKVRLHRARLALAEVLRPVFGGIVPDEAGSATRRDRSSGR